MQNEIVYRPNVPSPHHAEMFKDQAWDFHVDANYWAIKEGSSLSSAVWTVLDGDVTVGADSESSNISTALVTTVAEGSSLIEVKLTLADAQIGIQFIRIITPVVEKRGIKY
jgi:hypothetical protein